MEADAGMTRTPQFEIVMVLFLNSVWNVPNVVYSCGSLLHESELIIPYAMSDPATSFATVSLDELLAAME
jgi:hypothetical protein